MSTEIHPFSLSEPRDVASQWIESDRPQWPYLIRSLCSSIAIMIGAYFLWAQNYGNTGFAIFLVATACLFVWNLAQERREGANFVWVTLLSIGLLLGCARLVWQPNALVCIAGLIHLLAIAMAMQGPHPGALGLVLFAFHSAVNGVARWIQLPWIRIANGMSPNQLAWLSWGIPLLAGILFMIPLIQSQPDLAMAVVKNLSLLIQNTVDWLTDVNIVAILLVSIVGIWSLGVLVPRRFISKLLHSETVPCANEEVCSQLTYFVSRNTLIVVSCVFVWFLCVEIRSTWFRDFPEGFIYSTFAHTGAAWLTVALAMSTVLLSVLFRSQVHKHPRMATLQRLAWFWSGCNALLVLATFYRMIIYVNFNGMTRMRIIGFVGVACVFAGFVIVNSRIMRQKSIAWILHKQCWAFLWSIYLLALLPMDAISHRWNEFCIRSGKLAPAVQIAVHPISDEGMLCLFPLLDSETVEIREGVSAILAERFVHSLALQAEVNSNRSWTQFCGSSRMLEYRFAQFMPQLEPFIISSEGRQKATDRFRNWSRRWY